MGETIAALEFAEDLKKNGKIVAFPDKRGAQLLYDADAMHIAEGVDEEAVAPGA
jgi:hypothetical protein